MIERQQNEYNWQFTFLGANIDAFGEASGLGIARSSSLQYDTSNSQAAFGAASANVGRMRSASKGGLPVESSYTDLERESADKGKQ